MRSTEKGLSVTELVPASFLQAQGEMGAREGGKNIPATLLTLPKHGMDF